MEVVCRSQGGVGERILYSKRSVVAFQSHGGQAKQGDGDAHGACCQVIELSAVIKRVLLVSKERCHEFGGDARSSPPAESGPHLEDRAKLY